MNGRDARQQIYAALAGICLGVAVVSYYLAAANRKPIYLIGVFIASAVGISSGFMAQYYRARRDAGTKYGLDTVGLIARAYKDAADVKRQQGTKSLRKDT